MEEATQTERLNFDTDRVYIVSLMLCGDGPEQSQAAAHLQTFPTTMLCADWPVAHSFQNFTPK